MNNRSIDQDSIFARTEGDAWYRRNAEAMASPEIRENDPALELIFSIDRPLGSVLEVGCATGWRLDAVATETGALCVGVDVSEEALKEGKRRFGDLVLLRARASSLPIAAGVFFDLVVASFVFHWIDRRHLLRAVAEIDRVLADGGWLVVADFFPDLPTKVPYHHLEGSGIYTFKQDYSELFRASGMYKLEDMIVFDHEDPANRAASGPEKGLPPEIDEYRRAAAWRLRKDVTGIYREGGAEAIRSESSTGTLRSEAGTGSMRSEPGTGAIRRRQGK